MEENNLLYLPMKRPRCGFSLCWCYGRLSSLAVLSVISTKEKGLIKILSNMPKELYTVYRRKQVKASKNLKLPYDNNNKITQIDNH